MTADLKKAVGLTGAVVPEEDAGEKLEWVCHPFKRSPWKSVGVSAIVLFFGILVWLGTESRMFTSLSMVILFLSLSKFYLPTRYKLTEKKIYVMTTTHTLVKEWTMFRSIYPDKNGVLLSTFAGPSRLENFRGLYLLFENNGDEVVAYVRKRMPAATQTGSASAEAKS
jgi:hypothetical protein